MISEEQHMMQRLQQSLLSDDLFLIQLKTKLAAIPQSTSLQVKTVSHQQIISSDLMNDDEPNFQLMKKQDIDFIIQEISVMLTDLIDRKLQYEMSQIIQQNNNHILFQIRQQNKLIFNQQHKQQQKENQNYPILGGSRNFYQQQARNQLSFSDVHHLIAQSRKHFQFQAEHNIGDADIQKSLSCLVEFKFQSIEQRVVDVDRRLRTMEDKYQTNLKGLWNVLSMTESAVFDFINREKQREKQQQYQGSSKKAERGNDQRVNKSDVSQKRSGFFKLW